MINKIISGGQTGADMGALIVAKEFGVETGGWMPPRFATEQGFHPEYAKLFGCQEHGASGFAPRTYANVRDSDGTIRLSINFETPGEKCTRKAIRQYHKPWTDVKLLAGIDESKMEEEQKRVAQWIKDNKIETLNVAGNRESSAPGICKRVQKFLGGVFKLLED